MLIPKEQFKAIILAVAKKHKFRPGIVEKDYYLTVILNAVDACFGDKIVFKGGTLLNKIHLNYHRLSEDLDFVYNGKEELRSRSNRSKAITPIREAMPNCLKQIDLRSDKPGGEGFNNSTQYIFNVKYASFITDKEENIKIEVGLRQQPIDKPIYNTIKHFYQDPFTGEDLIPANKILSLSLNEAIAEKLKAAITRRDIAIRDYYDLWHIAEAKFNFHDKKFVGIFKKKLEGEGYRGNFTHNFGLTQDKVELLRRQVESDLIPVIRADERFDLDKVFARFDEILNAKKKYFPYR
ncbi:MAG: nucleotidyl transferase AbiEii/AbiGii toxin family protein [Candidatus Omnitrophota bacterium]